MSRWDDLKAAEQALIAAKKDIEDIKLDILQNECPIKIGDVLTVPKDAYVHIGKQAQVTSVSLTNNYRGYEKYGWCIFGLVINKDGKVGQKKVHFVINVKEDQV